jgi:hypothetical protein
MGVEPDHSGSGSFHVMFSVVVHLIGRFVSVLIPLADGPRHCGQFSASTVEHHTRRHCESTHG